MNPQRFAALVGRLERESAERPRRYAAKVIALTLLGFAILGLVLGMAGLGLLLLAGLAVATVLTGGKALILLLKFGKLLILLAVPLWVLVKHSVRALFVRLPAPHGWPLHAHQAPALFDALRRMREQLGGPRVHHVLLVHDVNAAVVQRPLFGLAGFPRNYVLLGLPLLESLSPDEALAVVAHEYGHLAGSHSRFAAFIYRLRLTWGTIQHHAEQWQGWTGRAMKRLIGWYAPYFNAYTFVLARANEYQADRAAADLVGAQAAADALKRVNLASPRYDRFFNQALARISESPTPPRDLLARWGDEAGSALVAADAQTWLDQALARQTDLTDTHPALAARLQALPGQTDTVARPPADRCGPSAAQVWLGAHLAVARDHFQQAWADQVNDQWRERHATIQAQRQRLAALHAQTERSADEALERLQLMVQLEPDTDCRDALAAYNAAHPDRPGALYLEGCHRLDRHDEAGIELLERAMALDADAVKPGCERAYAYLRAQGDNARAERFAERWRHRDMQESDRAREAGALNTRHAVRAAELPPEVDARVRSLLAAVDRRGIAAAYLVRRVLPSDPAFATFVLGVRTTWWTRRRGRQRAIVNRLAALEWPIHVIVCTLEGSYGGAYAKAICKRTESRVL